MRPSRLNQQPWTMSRGWPCFETPQDFEQRLLALMADHDVDEIFCQVWRGSRLGCHPPKMIGRSGRDGANVAACFDRLADHRPGQQ